MAVPSKYQTYATLGLEIGPPITAVSVTPSFPGFLHMLPTPTMATENAPSPDFTATSTGDVGALAGVKNDSEGVGLTQLSSFNLPSLGWADSLRAWHVPKYRNAISRKIINFFIVLFLIITIVYLIYYISSN